MVTGTSLNEYEKGQIDLLKSQGLSNRKIAAQIKRSHDCVNNYVNSKYGGRKMVGRGRKPKLTDREVRHIRNEVSKTGASIDTVRRNLRLKVCKTTVHSVIKGTSYLERRKFKKKPPLTAKHRAKRLEWSHAKMGWTKQWENVVFTDEKKFNFDGPDGYQYYWHDLRKEEKFLSRRQQGGGSVMVWTGFSYDGKCNLMVFESTVKAVDYQVALETHFLPFKNRFNQKL